MESVVIFDGTTYFVESAEYILGEDDEIVFTGSIPATGPNLSP